MISRCLDIQRDTQRVEWGPRSDVECRTRLWAYGNCIELRGRRLYVAGGLHAHMIRSFRSSVGFYGFQACTNRRLASFMVPFGLWSANGLQRKVLWLVSKNAIGERMVTLQDPRTLDNWHVITQEIYRIPLRVNGSMIANQYL